MEIILNQGHIARYARIGQITSIGGLLLLVAGLVISFTNAEQVSLSLAALLFGFALSQVGIYLGNRYARSPRPDEAIEKALKGLDKNHTLYHYVAPSAHVLVALSGIWILVPKPQRGHITYEKGKWRQRGGIGLAYLKIFAQEGIGRPDLEVAAEISSMKKFLVKEIPDHEYPEPQAVLVFTNNTAVVDANEAPIPTMTSSKLKDFIRKPSRDKSSRLTQAQLRALRAVLEADLEE